MPAAELGLAASSENGTSWESLARNVFNEQVARWDDKTCGGGLCSQIYTFNHGYDVKETSAQSTFFLLAARLARFTGNQTYVDRAAQTYDWMLDSTEVSAPAAFIAYGCAILANITPDAEWANRTTSHVDHLLSTFFPSNIMTEYCQSDSGDDCPGETQAEIATTLNWPSLIPIFQPATYASTHAALDATASKAARAPVHGGRR